MEEIWQVKSYWMIINNRMYPALQLVSETVVIRITFLLIVLYCTVKGNQFFHEWNLPEPLVNRLKQFCICYRFCRDNTIRTKHIHFTRAAEKEACSNMQDTAETHSAVYTWHRGVCLCVRQDDTELSVNSILMILNSR